MKVSELADELGVPASAVLEQCQRFGIEAGWAGAELKGADLVVLRAEMASADSPLDLRPADGPDVADGPDAAEEDFSDIAVPHPAAPEGEALTGAGRGAAATPPPLPPTAVGSMPELIDEITPEPEVEPSAGLRTTGPGPGPAPVIDDDGQRRIPPRPLPAKKVFERAVMNSLVWLAVAAVAFAASNVLGNPWAVAGLWILTVFCLVVAFYDANRGRRAVATHADRRRGLPVAVVASVLAAAGLVGMASLVVISVRDEPAADAPLGAGDLPAVESARWGYLRLTRIIDEGWKQPAKEAGSCWEEDAEREVRMEQRVEVGNVRRGCSNEHTVEIAQVFALDRQADAPYPSAEEILVAVQEECAEVFADAQAAAEGMSVQLLPEYPTEAGWKAGDRDIACALVTPLRSGALLD